MKEHALTGRKQSSEHIAKRNRRCDPGCECKKHTSWKAGVEAAKDGVAKAKAAGVYKEASKKTRSTRANWSPERHAEVRARMSEAKRKEWAQAKAEGRRRNIHFGTKKKTSKHELALIPYMEALGYKHNQTLHIGRKVPDFIDEENKHIYEYFGTYWHEPEDEDKVIEYYSLRGYSCRILWESDLFNWLSEHKELVTEDEHELAWKVAHVNNGYKKPGQE